MIDYLIESFHQRMQTSVIPFLLPTLLLFIVSLYALKHDTHVTIDDSSLEEIRALVQPRDPPSSLRLLKYVGKGSSGHVYKAVMTSTHKIPSHDRSSQHLSSPSTSNGGYVAVKVIPLRREKLGAMKRELQILSRLGHHKNVVNFHAAYIQEREGKVEGKRSASPLATMEKRMVESGEGKYLWIIMQWIEGVKLGRIVDANAVGVRNGERKEGGAFSLEEGRRMGRDILEGLSYLHNHIGCAHGDLDVSNVMIKDQRAILIDLGGGRFEREAMGMDCLRAVYAIVEMTMTPERVNEYDDGPVNIKQYSNVRKESVPMLLKDVVRGEFEVPEEVRALAHFAISNVKGDTKADELLRHSFFHH